MGIATINPATGETIRSFEPIGDDELERRLALAAEAFGRHRKSSFEERARKMRKAADLLERDQRELAETITLEMGKPIRAALAEISKCALACGYYAANAAAHLADDHVKTEATESYVRYLPLGPVLAIMPWNFPFWQVFRFAAPAIMAGNVGLLKHASNVPQCALAIERVIREAGFEEGVFQTLLLEASRVEAILRDPRVRAATLTGSEPAGASVASIAGREIKKVVLELGGSDPFIVMPSADLPLAAETAARARTVNAGQSCIAAKRFIVHEEVASEFETRFVAAMQALVVGDPMDEKTDLGPLSSRQIADDLERQVAETLARGARVLTGGRRREGNWFEPTVLVDVPLDSPGAREELFGPVASVFRVRSIDEAIALANSTPFGLAASVWTNDEKERSRFTDEIEAGQLFVNAMVASDPRLPFGGVGRSGFGRELGELGIREFVNAKTVWVA
ncbi:MAG TPA: NAD-dependent succinate-semialdehyde dehydrogenase [Thermoanaerobaculia bacterium]|nr:NAD-dependent succinate-semialdehyde dehydrogenase [Thermoanaerobaculia bacterium]